MRPHGLTLGANEAYSFHEAFGSVLGLPGRQQKQGDWTEAIKALREGSHVQLRLHPLDLGG